MAGGEFLINWPDTVLFSHSQASDDGQHLSVGAFLKHQPGQVCSAHENLRICSLTGPQLQPLPGQQKRVESGEEDAWYIPLANDARENSSEGKREP